MSLNRPFAAISFVSAALFAMPAAAEVIPLAPEPTLLAASSTTQVETLQISAQSTSQVSPTILKMADGTFYHPASGVKARTENELRSLVGLPLLPGSEPTTPVVVEQPKPTILRAVYRAQEELHARIKAEGMDKLVSMKPIGQDAPRPVTIAVWNRTTDEITYVKAMKQGKDLVIETPSPTKITVHTTNWINSDYDTADPNFLVVAVRYPIYNEVKEGKKVVSYNAEQAVYTPYTKEFMQPEIAVEGERLLDEMITNALADLRARGIKSRPHPDKLMADIIDRHLIKALAIIEHTDGTSLKANADTAVKRVYVTLALNPGSAYNYSRSSAGALGLMQFIPSTYNRLAARTYLGLKPNFQDGMRDHTNALKASVVYLDSVLGDFSEDVQAQPNSPRTYEYLAAAYNGGSARVKRAVVIWDDQINGVLKPVEILKRSRLFPETIDYVKKMRRALPAVMGQAIAPSVQET